MILQATMAGKKSSGYSQVGNSEEPTRSRCYAGAMAAMNQPSSFEDGAIPVPHMNFHIFLAPTSINS